MNAFSVEIYMTKKSSLILVLNNEFVVTAAHCLMLADTYEIHLGALDRSNFNEPGRLILNTTVTKQHEKFNILAHNDIGLLRLPQKVEFNDRIQPVKLAMDADDLYEGRTAVASGWGLQHDGKDQSPPNTLQYADLKVITNKDCKKHYVFLVIKSTTLCAKGEQLESTCNGDSGGPLVLKDTNELIGLTSFGNKNGCEKGIPVGFTRVNKYLDWIRENANLNY